MASRALLAVLGAAVGVGAKIAGTGVLSTGGTVYSYVNGGQDWNTGAKGVALCGTSVVQSPINIPSQVVTYGVAGLAPLNVSYGTSSDWMLEVTANYLEVADIDTNTTGVDVATSNTFTDGLTLADGTFVPLNQFHFHTPSEHTINGAHYPLEMHMVHKLFRTNTSTALAPVRTAGNTPGATLQRAAVIGIMFAYSPDGKDQPFMDNLQDAFFALAALNFSAATTFSTTETSANNQFSLQSEVFGANAIGTSDYFTYNGSLTTPGCNEGITWFLMNKPMYASPKQILALTRALALDQGGYSRGADNRLVQPLGNRSIFASFAQPTGVNISVTHSLAGLTVASFTTAKQTAFIGLIATTLNVRPSAVTISSITDASSRRRLLGAAIAVTTVVSVPSTAKTALAAQLSATAASPAFVTSVNAATGSTGVVNPATAQPPVKVSAAPAVKSAVAAVLAAAVLALAF